MDPRQEVEEYRARLKRPLFVGALDDGLDAWVGDATWYHYALGYREAARHLVDEARAHGHLADQFVYPAVFLYRHYLELVMKSFVLDNAGRVGLPKDFEKTHDLLGVWRACREVAERWWPSADATELADIERLVKELDDVDRRSENFRYPVNKKGGRSLPDHLRSFNLRHFAEQVECVGDAIESWDVGIHEEASWQAEMAAEARHEASFYDDSDGCADSEW